MSLLPTRRIRIRPTIILFGDSITEFAFGQQVDDDRGDGDGSTGISTTIGWSSLLASAYSRRADVLSRGFSGYNTKHAISVMPSIFGNTSDNADHDDGHTRNENHSPEVPVLFYTVFFGANDASLPTARQHLPIEEYESNMRQIVNNIRSSPSNQSTDSNSTSNQQQQQDQPPIILFTPPPVSAKAWDHYCTVTSPRPLSPRSNDNCREYGKVVQQIAKDMDCAVVDTFSLLGGDQDDVDVDDEEYYAKYFVDGLHLNNEGNAIVYRGLMETLKEHHHELLPMVDGDGRYGSSGVPLEEKLWSELC
mmetsp:Transcript_5141/g.7604  ORF Transcript_5141/g.7604 Transcript_5141/m.7604 type:complete len:306 (+) Transcript_5141:34-951(+)